MRKPLLKISVAVLYLWMILAFGGGSARAQSGDCNFYQGVCRDGGGAFERGTCHQGAPGGQAYCDFTCQYPTFPVYGACWL